MFGFQRTGDGFWAAMDQLTRGFVLGATAGRTTLNGEGLQHEDGHSPLLAATNPAVVAYDPAFGFEIAHIVKDGLRRMYGEDSENIFYYLTIYNEPYQQPVEPENVDVEGILRGLHLYSPTTAVGGPRVQLLASGVAVQWALQAQVLLATDWGVGADVWSVTSWNELRRDGLRCDRAALLAAGSDAPVPYVTARLAGRPGPVVAVSDYQRAVQDGWGMSDTRGALRRHFLVDAESITSQALLSLARRGEIGYETVREAVARYRLSDPRAAAAGNTEGAG
jgi:pyruvate dehydrogenase E1 component